MSGLLVRERFVAVFPSLVRALGNMEAAAILQLLNFYADDEGVVVMTMQAVADETGLNVKTVQRRIKMLRDMDLLRVQRNGTFDSTNAYLVNTAHPSLHHGVAPEGPSGEPLPDRVLDMDNLSMSDMDNLSISPLLEGKNPAGPSADADEDEALPLGAAFEPPEPDPQEKNGQRSPAQALVATWVDGHREANDGNDPHPAMLRRAAGQCKQLAKTCETAPQMRAAMGAALAAGKAGVVDPVPFLAKRTSQFEKPKTREQKMFEEGWE